MIVARPWFRAKTLGWGWGLPLTWQGWIVYAAYTAVLAAGWWRYPPPSATGTFMGIVAGSTALVVLVCTLTGEKPGSRSR